MKLAIQKVGDDIQTYSEFDDAEDRGEISHFICQLELLKKQLLELWDNFDIEEELEE